MKGSIPFVAFLSAAGLCGPATAQVITRISTSTGCDSGNGWSRSPAISNDGCLATFMSLGSNLVPGDTNGKYDIFVRDRCHGTTSCLSITPSGAPGNGDSIGQAVFSSDGRYVAFASDASDLVAGDTNGVRDIFVRDLALGVTRRVSVSSMGEQSNGYSEGPGLSGDGRYVVFMSYATNFDAADQNTWPDVYLHDRDPDANGVFDEGNGTTQRISVAIGGGATNGNSFITSISADGRYIAYYSDASNILPGGPTGSHTYVFDRNAGTTIAVDLNMQGLPTGFGSSPGPISANGRFIVFDSFASDLVPNDTNGGYDTFVRDLVLGTTERVSVTSTGAQATGDSYYGSISDDGRYVVFVSTADLAGPHHVFQQVFVRDRALGLTFMVQGSPEVQIDGPSDKPRITPDARGIVFESQGDDLVVDNGGSEYGAYYYDTGLVAPPLVTFCSGDGSAGPCPCGNSGLPGHGCNNSTGTGGARLTANGTTNPDTIELHCANELNTVATVFIQGTVQHAALHFGDGLLCIGGNLKRLALTLSLGSSANYTSCPNPPITARSAELGDPIVPGSTRYYTAYYRDSSFSFCAAPLGNTWNASQAIAIAW